MARDLYSARSEWSVSINRQTTALGKTSGSGWSGNVYLDLDVILAELKADDWLASAVDVAAMAAPKTSVATGIELQYAMENEWPRDRVVSAHTEISDLGVDLIPLRVDALDAAAELRSQYDSVNVFDGVHLGTAQTLDEPIVSTDTLYAQIPEVESLDPRKIE